jgi:hypothetical protein
MTVCGDIIREHDGALLAAEFVAQVTIESVKRPAVTNAGKRAAPSSPSLPRPRGDFTAYAPAGFDLSSFSLTTD